MPSISIVTTLYRSAPYIAEFYSRSLNAAVALNLDPEFIFVDDGSPDESRELALALRATDTRIQVIELSRNFGHHNAVMAGLAHSTGDFVFLLDCDLEEAPENLTEFWGVLHSTGSDVVFGVQARRERGLGDRITGSLFYSVFNHLSDHQIPHNVAMCRLMTKSYVDSLRLFGEKNFFLAALFQEAGFKQTAISIEKRDKGTSTYNLGRKVALMVNAITTTSSRPLLYVFYLGAIVSGIAFLAGLAVLYFHLFVSPLQVGWPSIILSIWFIGGLILLSVGLVGVYVAKIFQESKRKPVYIVRQIN